MGQFSVEISGPNGSVLSGTQQAEAIAKIIAAFEAAGVVFISRERGRGEGEIEKNGNGLKNSLAKRYKFRSEA
jgi:hypothetical protein